MEARPTRRKPGRSRFCRCPGLFSHICTTVCGAAPLPTPHARFSANAGPTAPKCESRQANAPWPKYSCRSISSEWKRAARSSLQSTRSGARPSARRAPFRPSRSACSGGVSPEAVDGAAHTSAAIVAAAAGRHFRRTKRRSFPAPRGGVKSVPAFNARPAGLRRASCKPTLEADLDTWIWILIVIVVLVVIGIAVFAARRARERQLETKRHEANELRETSAAQARRADEREAMARETAEQARADRQRSEDAAQRAAEVDPDTDD